MNVIVTHAKAAWPQGASVGSVVSLPFDAIPESLAGKCSPAPEGAEPEFAYEPPPPLPVRDYSSGLTGANVVHEAVAAGKAREAAEAKAAEDARIAEALAEAERQAKEEAAAAEAKAAKKAKA